MYRKTMAFGRKGIGMVAISAVDIALWDALGKSAKQPCYRLMGGRTKSRIPVYASRLTARRSTISRRKRRAYKSEGYKAMKLRFGWGPVDGAEGMRKNLDLVRTVRETVGDGIDVMADAYMGWTLDYAKRMLPLLEPFNLRWLEEPVIPDDIQGYAQLKAYGRVPIAGGEHEFTLFGARDLLQARAVDYLQVDINRVGGLTAARKISALAEAHQVPVIPHAGQMHNYHLVMASLNSPMAEHFPVVDVEVGNELFWYIFDGEPKAVDGHIDLDENKPGPRFDDQRRQAARIRGDRMTTRIVQLTDGVMRRVALVDEPYLRLGDVGSDSLYALAAEAIATSTPLSEIVRRRATGEVLDYDQVYAGRRGVAVAFADRSSR